MIVKELIKLLKPVRVINMKDHDEIRDICYDSREVKSGSLFVAISGTHNDGHRFIQQAYDKGAVATICEHELSGTYPNLILVPSSRDSMSLTARAFFGYPDRKLFLIGITGTNGKTTTAHIVYNIFNLSGRKTGLMGTLGYRLEDRYHTMERTTPESVDIFRLLREMTDRDTRAVAMEISSHGLDQKRVAYLDIDLAAFTNLTQDHLDYHKDMESYFRVKSTLFNTILSPAGISLINIDDPWGQRLAESHPPHLYTCGVEKEADFMAQEIEYSPKGTSFTFKAPDFTSGIVSPLKGRFNLYNSLMAGAICSLAGIVPQKVKEGLEMPFPVRGRLEEIKGKQDFQIFIDYAHTPDALQNLLNSVREFTPNRILLVFGCGGNRDRLKRPLMGEIAQNLADVVIITSDNPRDEEPGDIIDMIIKGIKDCRRVRTELSRESAIRLALESAQTGDTVLIAGKGHEDYQEIKGRFIPFDDREVVLNWLHEKGFGHSRRTKGGL
ncbi:UDP-N-acetylmuramoyl-L-alanyl-D-glutamate--2,6-diaminopimelate ligase [bacterium]|nr:UDP-N-acetylmuramoyl-L-alanyl-D-glutamate--2,6-diaminopimelate ligase [bacterium]